LDIEECHLQSEPSNSIRNWVKMYALEHKLSFYDTRNHEGFLRNLIIRNTSEGEIMLIMVFGQQVENEILALLNGLKENFAEVTSICWVINEKHNDTISDLPVELFYGKPFITEQLGDLSFRISPISFFQTNSFQAKKLYDKVLEACSPKGNEVVYDLYSGTGSITLYIARHVAKVVGVEYVSSAVEDAHINAELNGIHNVSFHTGDLAKVFTDEFVAENGIPDLIITDPPRAGMHENVVQQIIKLLPEKIVYVSCNPASQARDIKLLSEHYHLLSIQAVDMFPHTHHVENIGVLVRK
jgi:23S rRNA (uracil1939-C5)-methyltransferase